MPDVVEKVPGHLERRRGAGMGAGRGYAVAILSSVDVGPEIKRYMERIESTFEPFGGEWVVHGTQPEVLEGPGPGDLVIIGFPTIAAARDWYASGAYQDILGLRTEHARSQVVLVEGVPPGYQAGHTIAKMFGS